jgi:hypothetical protein
MPAEVKSKFEVSTIKDEDPPPKVMVPVEVPELIWVSKLDEWLRDIELPVEERPVKAATPAAVTFPPEVTSKFVKSIKEVEAVVPAKMVSQPEPTLMALEVEPPVAEEILIPVPEVAPVAAMSKRPEPV